MSKYLYDAVRELCDIRMRISCNSNIKGVYYSNFLDEIKNGNTSILNHKEYKDYIKKKQEVIESINYGADLHYYGEVHKNMYDTFQLALVLDLDDIVEHMFPKLKHNKFSPYYDRNCNPLLLHLKHTNKNLYEKYLPFASQEEKKQALELTYGDFNCTKMIDLYNLCMTKEEMKYPDRYVQHNLLMKQRKIDYKKY